MLVAVLVLHVSTPSILSGQPGARAGATRAEARVLSLPEALDIARRTSPALLAAREAVTSARALERQAGAFANPTISYQHEAASGGGIDNSQGIASIDQPLDVAGRSARRRAAENRRAAADARLRDAEAALDLTVVRAYAQVLAADRRAGLASDAAAVFARARVVSEARLQSGDISGFAHRRLRLEAARYTSLGADAALASRAARLALAILLSPEVSPADVATLELRPAEPSAGQLPLADSLLVVALANRDDLRAAMLETKAAEADAQFASRSRLPTPVLTAGMKTEQLSGVGELNGLVAGISLPLPLWDRRRGSVDAAAADARRAAARLDIEQRRVTQEVLEAMTAVEAIEAQLGALAPALGAVADSALRSAEIAYAEGEIQLIEWLDAVRAYQEAEASLASLQAESLIRHAALRRAAGLTYQRNVP